MSKYKEENLTGQKWVRSNRVTVLNPYDGAPVITFSEEEVALLSDGRSVNTPVGNLQKTFDDPIGSFDLLNPVDGSVIGSATYQDVYVILHSLYIWLAQERDSVLAAQAVVE